MFAALAEHHQAQPDMPLTTAQIGERCGLGERAARVHLSHLVRHRRIRSDRRTPVRGATVRKGGEVPAEADASMWAANMVTPDRTCGTLLVAYGRAAGDRWSGQISMADLAATYGIALRTAKRHRPHLVAARLVEFRTATVLAHDGRHRIRLADRFRLLSGVTVAPPTGRTYAEDMAGDQAKTLVDSVPWYCASPADMERGYRLVAARIRDGWPAGELLRRVLYPEPDAHVTNPYGLLSDRLPARGDAFVIPAEDFVRGATGNPRCTSCGVRMRPSTDGLCRECREDRAVPFPRSERAEAERAFAGLRSA
jgi:hypothetical protein